MAIGGFDASLRERIHQGGFPGVCITDQRHRWIRNFEPALALIRARALDLAKPLAQASEAFPHSAPVDFEAAFHQGRGYRCGRPRSRRLRPGATGGPIDG